MDKEFDVVVVGGGRSGSGSPASLRWRRIGADDALACSYVRQAIAASFTNSAVRNGCECRARKTPFLGKQLLGSLRDESI